MKVMPLLCLPAVLLVAGLSLAGCNGGPSGGSSTPVSVTTYTVGGSLYGTTGGGGSSNNGTVFRYIP